MSEKKVKHPLSGKALSAEIDSLIERIQHGDRTAERIMLLNCQRYTGYEKKVRSSVSRKQKKRNKGAKYARIHASQINAGGGWPYRR